MALPHLVKTTLSSMPNLQMLFLKVLFKKSSYDPNKPTEVLLPDNQYYFDGVELDETSYSRYHQVVGWDTESDFIHPCYLHSLAFPLHLSLLSLPKFPFPLLGLVHVNNQIRQIRPVKKSEKLTVSSYFGQLALHPKGWLFSIQVEFYSGSELVWKSISTNLFRTGHGYAVDPITKYSPTNFTKPTNTTCKLSASLGRRYAKVSGDFNPIHLSKWSAKLFGFKQHIIHGMWTKSYCISALQKENPALFLQAYEINTTFKQPLYLPSQVNMAVDEGVNDGQDFKVTGIGDNDQQQPVHLFGNIRSI